MTSTQLIDPALAPLLEQFNGPKLTRESLPQIRAMMESMTQTQPDAAVEVRTLEIPGPENAPPVRVVVYAPRDAARPMAALLHLHGGGYVIGAPEIADSQSKFFAREIGCTVVSVDYRLAPETPFPGPIEDCYAALKWLSENTGDLGIDRSRIAIGGESAGGGLAAALSLLARDRGEVPVAFELLTYPMLDDRTCAIDDPHPFAGEFIWTREDNCFGWTSLLGHQPGGTGVSPYAAAARAQDLRGLPSTFIAVGALDLFLEENLEYARRLMRAGVPVELHVYPGAFHGFNLISDAMISRAMEHDRQSALARALRPGS